MATMLSKAVLLSCNFSLSACASKSCFLNSCTYWLIIFFMGKALGLKWLSNRILKNTTVSIYFVFFWQDILFSCLVNRVVA
jgi:preprotein translocase subunit SecG